jgi:hypothetical protein
MILGRRRHEGFAEWVEELHAARQLRFGLSQAGDEVVDPYQRRLRVHERVARRLEHLVLESGDCAFDPAIPEAENRWRESRLIWRA